VDGRDVAIKHYNGSDTGVPYDTVVELHCLSQLGNHLGIVKLLSLGISYGDNHLTYMTITMPMYTSDMMKFIRRICIKDRLAALISIINQVVPALNYIHSKGIVHGDVKPQNILMNYQYDCTNLYSNVECVVSDFGASRLTKSLSNYDLQSGFAKAPEDVTGSSTYKSDIWALGISLLIYIMGVEFGNPYSPPGNNIAPWFIRNLARSSGGLSDHINVENVVYPLVVNPNVKSLLESMLQVNQSERYGDVEIIYTAAAIQRAPIMVGSTVSVALYYSYVEWMIKVAHSLGMYSISAVCAHDIADRALTKINPENIRFFFISCLTLGMKVLSDSAYRRMGSIKLTSYLNGEFEVEDISDMEIKIMGELNYILYHREIELYSDKLKRLGREGNSQSYDKYLQDINHVRDSGIYWGNIDYTILSQL
jgi:serine/threonine protein kinase